MIYSTTVAALKRKINELRIEARQNRTFSDYCCAQAERNNYQAEQASTVAQVEQFTADARHWFEQAVAHSTAAGAAEHQANQLQAEADAVHAALPQAA